MRKKVKLLFFLVLTGLISFFITAAFIAAFAYFQDQNEPSTFEKADLIVVLGAGMDPDGTLHRSSSLRVEKGVKLFQQGAASRIHFSGGRGKPNGPSAGEKMGELAESLGVPKNAISSENESQSTLQNALFSRQELVNADRIILVTEGFHLPRSWLSINWAAGLSKGLSIDFANSEPFRTQSPNMKHPESMMVVREALAFWFNLGRVVVWHTAVLVGVDQEKRDNLLK